MKINREWHLKNRMPKNPTKHQRAIWHIEHAKPCNCRKLTPSIIQLIKEVGFEPPKQLV